MTLTLLTYNNKFNRIVKRPLPSVDAYLDAGAIFRIQLDDVQNWNPNDHVYTQHVFNYEGPTPDYLIAEDDDGMLSRWFVTEAKRTRYGQYQVTLYRDLLADFFNEVVSAPMYVERAMASFGDSALYNDEGLSVNQILQKKDLLYDQTGCPWIVGYVPKSYPETPKQVTFAYYPVPDYTVVDIEDFTYYSELNKPYLTDNQTLFAEAFYTVSGGTANAKRGCTLQLNQSSITGSAPTNQAQWSNLTVIPPVYQGTYEGTVAGQSEGGIYVIKDIIDTALASCNPGTVYSNACNATGFTTPNTALEALVGKTIRDTTADVYYRIVKETSVLHIEKKIESLSGALWTSLENVFSGRSKDGFVEYSTPSFQLVADLKMVSYSLRSVGAAGEVDFTKERTKLEDQPYDMFCIPYSDDIWLEYNGIQGPRFTKALGMGFAQQLAADLGSSAVYDIQILPYCPVPHLFKIVNGVKMMEFKDVACTEINSQPVGGAAQVIGALFWSSRSQFSFNLDYEINLPINVTETKVMQICDKYRLCSPNMSSFFDFDPVKNDGVYGFEVDCYYKPFNPYIHINPKFGGIYGEADWEVRGLDLTGNFSLSQVTSAWADYQLQNKNFQNIFDRQQEHLQTVRKHERVQQIAGAAAGALGAGVSAGVASGNVAVGAVAGVLSGAAGAADVMSSEKLHQENLDYNQANYTMSLDNIQALPESLTRVDTLSPNNPLIPYIEYYTCTEIERVAVQNKIKYNSMTINRIGTIQEFLKGSETFIRGSLIRIPALEDDYHIASEIAKQLLIGVFI